MKAQASVLLIIIGLFLFGCNYTIIKGDRLIDGVQPFSLPTEQTALLSFSYVYEKVFQPKCISCHGKAEGVSLESYEDIAVNILKIKRSVFETKSMPKRGELDKEEQAILWTWLDMGAPKDSVAAGSEVGDSNGGGPGLGDGSGDNPNPDREGSGDSSGSPVLPLTATFSSISKNIFEPKCVSCHAVGKDAKRILLDKASLLNSPLELIVPGDADESGLIIAVERDDKNRMPPEKEGYSKLSDAELTAMRTWIVNGAID